MKVFYSTLFVLFQLFGNAQNPYEVDSLKKVLETQANDTNRVNTLLNLVMAEQYIWGKSEHLLNESLLLSRKIGFWIGEAKTFQQYAYTINKINEPIKALNYYDSAYVVYKNHHDELGMAKAKYGKASILDKLGNIEMSFQIYIECLQLFERLNYQSGVGSCYINMGNILHSKGETEKAMSYMHQSVAIQKSEGNLKSEGICYSNLGNHHKSLGNMDSALYYFREALRIKVVTYDIRGIAAAYNRLGYYWESQGRLDSTSYYYDKALNIFLDVQENDKISMMRIEIGELLLQQGKPSQALTSCKEGLKMGEELLYLDRQIEACFCIAKAYSELNKSKLAMEYFLRYDLLKDSLLNDDKKESMTKNQMAYEFEKQLYADSIKRSKENEIFNLKIEQERKDNEQQIAQQSNLAILGGIGFLLMIGLAIVLFKSNRQKQKSNNEIRLQKMLVEEKNQEILDSINYAKRIQSAILPNSKLVKEYLQDSFVMYIPKDIVAGDFYWMEPVNNLVLFAAADCTGHGVPGAMVSVVCNNGLNRAVREYGLTDPGEILDKTRELVIAEFDKAEEDVKDGMDIALCSLQGNTLKFAGAHNPLWIVRKGATEIEELKPNKEPIGNFDNPTPFLTHQIELAEGDAFYIFSDGFSDQFGGDKGKKFKSSKFKDLLLSVQDKTIAQQKIVITDAFENWKGTLEQLDDVCVIGVRIPH